MKNNLGFLPTTGNPTTVSLELPDTLSAEDWREAGLEIARTGSASKWWLGDWWRYGEHRYGDRKEIVDGEDWDGPKFQTCADAGMVAAAFETSRRREVLSFNHHREVCSLPVDWQDTLLDEAQDGGLSCAAMRQRVKEVKNHLSQGWTPDQMERQAAVTRGETVLANMGADDVGNAIDRALIDWADASGLLVRIDRKSDWGNPFVMGEDGDRATVIESFRTYYALKPSLHRRIDELCGKVLACWCCPDACHGEVLVEEVHSHGGQQAA